jgi:uncharacterized protein (TIGR02266 family)
MVRAAVLSMAPAQSREHSRARPRAPFSAQVRFFEWDHARTVVARDLSAGGIFLRSATPLAEGKLLTLRVELPGVRESFTALARVVRTVRGGPLREAGMGLEFIDVSSHDRRLIDSYVAARTAP